MKGGARSNYRPQRVPVPAYGTRLDIRNKQGGISPMDPHQCVQSFSTAWFTTIPVLRNEKNGSSKFESDGRKAEQKTETTCSPLA